jgi:hypothetical protein
MRIVLTRIMTRRTPIKKTLMKEKVKTPVKEGRRTPMKESKKTPTRERVMNSSTQRKKMYQSISRDTPLGWNYFLRARPDVYPELREWLLKTWGSAHPDTRRGFHMSGLKREYINLLKTRYEHVYDTNQITNNEVGTVFARAFACEVQGGIDVNWEDFNRHRSEHYKGSSSTNTGLKSSGTSHVDIPATTPVQQVLEAKVRATMTEKHEQMMAGCIASMSSRIQALLADLEAVKSAEIQAEKKFSSIKTTYEWIASTIQNSESEVLKEELKKELNNMGTQLRSQMTDLDTCRNAHEEIDNKLSALKLHSENLACLMQDLKQNGFDTLCPSVIEHPSGIESTITSIAISRYWL